MPSPRVPVSVAVLCAVVMLAGALAFALHLRTQSMLAIESDVPAAISSADAELDRPGRRVTLHIEDASDQLSRYFDRIDYRMPSVRDGLPVPRVYVSDLPGDLHAMQDIDRRKGMFLRTVLPLVLKENEQIRLIRNRLLALQSVNEDAQSPGVGDPQWLLGLYDEFGVKAGDLDRLLRRIDEVPASLALAQAAMESGWGTSRFVREGNALFGMWTWSEEDPGIVPLEREDHERHRIRTYATLAGSVHAYMRTLNTHWAYADFRKARARLRQQGKALQGLSLAGAISMYSEKRNRYTNMLRQVIRGNALHKLDSATLVGAPRTDSRWMLVAQGSGR